MASSVSDSKSGGVRAFMQFLAVSVIAGVVSAGLAIPAVGVGTAATQAGVDVFNALPSELQDRDLAGKSVMEASDGSKIAEFYWHNRVEVPLKKISKPMQDATVAVEDYRFFDHGGVDIQGIGRAMVHNMVSSTTQGGSTLTQQYVKNVLTEDAAAQYGEDDPRVAEASEGSGTAGYARKIREAKLAIAVEKKYSKKEILNRYMNVNNYSGSPRVYGVQAAAHRYWGINADKLDVAQAATLAGIVKNPALYNPQKNPKGTINRRNTVLDLMLKHGKIDQKEHDKAVKEKLALKLHSTPNGCTTAKKGMGYFCDYVQQMFAHDKAFGKTAKERQDSLARGGFTVRTSINPKMQKQAVKAIQNRVPTGDASGAGHTIVSVEPGSGKVLSMAQNRKYAVAEGKRNVDTQLNYNVPKKYNGTNGFQVGSTWKPFVLTEWLKEGHSLYNSVDASERTFGRKSWKYEGCHDSADNWTPRNAGDGEGSSSMSALQATVHSVNTGYAAMGNELNMCGVAETASSLGVKYGNGGSLEKPFPSLVKGANGKTKTVDSYPALGPSSILGVAQVAPIDMASAYAIFASGGTYCKPSPIVSIKDSDGKKVATPKSDCHKALDPNVAKNVAWALTQTFNGGTTKDLGISVPAGAKTGTTNFDVGATSLSGFTKKLSTTVWTGDPNRNRDWRYSGAGRVSGQIFGATISGKTWQSYMNSVVGYTSGNTGFSRGSGGGGGSDSDSGDGDGAQNRGGGGDGGNGGGKKHNDNGGGKKDGGNGNGGQDKGGNGGGGNGGGQDKGGNGGGGQDKDGDGGDAGLGGH